MTSSLHDVSEVKVLDHYRLRLTFSDGLIGDVDLSYLASADGIFIELHDPAYFARVHVDPEIGTVAWPNGADLAPEVLYERAAVHPIRRPTATSA